MRTRRRFQPSLDTLPLRLAPSDTNVLLIPTDPAAVPTSSGTYFVSPMDPGSSAIGVKATGPSTACGPGSFNTPPPLAPTPTAVA
ncbi:hypothetical protein OJF2_26700 [Aquisphaera giovannonii]|uniref:Uncharacterized protein n=1 Tax=Aquisphaera giovannonii TaxID=406548 RepID=A0A5B9W295_9BACT|nr:hypothetical protein [Aquisphaera giovannonii]QEH34135.1 hypothetical protein OJF2_26700 [Aquisphaera giovannonii]